MCTAQCVIRFMALCVTRWAFNGHYCCCLRSQIEHQTFILAWASSVTKGCTQIVPFDLNLPFHYPTFPVGTVVLPQHLNSDPGPIRRAANNTEGDFIAAQAIWIVSLCVSVERFSRNDALWGFSLKCDLVLITHSHIVLLSICQKTTWKCVHRWTSFCIISLQQLFNLNLSLIMRLV